MALLDSSYVLLVREYGRFLTPGHGPPVAGFFCVEAWVDATKSPRCASRRPRMRRLLESEPLGRDRERGAGVG